MRFFIDFLVSKEFSSEGRQTGCGGNKNEERKRGEDIESEVWGI